MQQRAAAAAAHALHRVLSGCVGGREARRGCAPSGRASLAHRASNASHVARAAAHRSSRLACRKILSRMLYYGFNLYAFYARLLARSFLRRLARAGLVWHPRHDRSCQYIFYHSGKMHADVTATLHPVGTGDTAALFLPVRSEGPIGYERTYVLCLRG